MGVLLASFSDRSHLPIDTVMNSNPRPGNRQVTRQDLAAVVGSLSVLGAFIALIASGHPLYGAAFLGSAMFVTLWAMSREEREAIGRELERRQRTPLRRVIRVFELLAGLLLLYLILFR